MTAWQKFLHNDLLGLAVRLALGLVFVYASIDKITNPADFARIVYNYHLLPGELINLVAIIMPWIEFVCGILLILGIYKEGSALIINAFIVIFAVAIAVNLFRGVDLECGCFSVSSRAKGSALSLLIRDMGYLALALYVLFNRSQKFQLLKSRITR
jgi:uncharacterized membrane protein YphA (DoxX/SURF4 family)